jgi:20S proteasome alpha/beta subunit
MPDQITKRRGGRSKKDRSAGRWKSPFLAAFANSGNIRASAMAAGVSRALIYKALENDEAFQADFEEAKDEAIELLEATLRQQALSGNTTALIFLLKSLDPQTYNDRVQVTGANSGPVTMVATMKLSDNE